MLGVGKCRSCAIECGKAIDCSACGEGKIARRIRATSIAATMTAAVIGSPSILSFAYEPFDQEVTRLYPQKKTHTITISPKSVPVA
jgi:hypothetical protein